MFKEPIIPSIGSLEMRVELDKKSLFALASDTRLDILRSLQPMRRTVTQLAETLNIDKAAVHRHLKKLEEGGLVKRYDEHGFVYYGLSWKARDLMSPNENTRIIVMLSSSWVLTVIVFFMLIASLFSMGLGSSSTGMAPTEWKDGLNSGDYQASQSFSGPLPWFILIAPAAALGAVAVMLTILSSRSIIRPKQPIGAADRSEKEDGQ